MLDTWPDYEDQQQPARKTVAPYWAVLLAILFGIAVAGALWSGKVYADPIFSTTAEGVTITLTDEPCAIAAITNLPYRAKWTEKGKSFEGCWAPHRELQVVIAYFDDKTVALIPIQAFAKVVGA